MFLGDIDFPVNTILWNLLPVDINDISRGPGVYTPCTKVSAGLEMVLSSQTVLPLGLELLSDEGTKGKVKSTFISGRCGQRAHQQLWDMLWT